MVQVALSQAPHVLSSFHAHRPVTDVLAAFFGIMKPNLVPYSLYSPAGDSPQHQQAASLSWCMYQWGSIA